MAGAFLAAAPESLSQVEAAVRSGDLAALAVAAHTFKGMSNTIGDGPLAGVCRAVEDAARDGDRDRAAAAVTELPGVLGRAGRKLRRLTEYP